MSACQVWRSDDVDDHDDHDDGDRDRDRDGDCYFQVGEICFIKKRILSEQSVESLSALSVRSSIKAKLGTRERERESVGMTRTTRRK